MSYSTFSDVKPKSENKKAFCSRIVKLLDEIQFYDNGTIYNNGKRMLNTLFKYSKLNSGFSSIDDLISESENKFKDIFELSNLPDSFITKENILFNIDIIVNCLNFPQNKIRSFYNYSLAQENLEIILKAIKNYLLGNNLKLEYNEEKGQFFILPNNLVIDIENIENKKVKTDVINFYDYKNENNLDEKKRILFDLIFDLETKRKDISNLFGKNTSEILFSYANNINIRHNNCDESNKKNYRPKIKELNEEELKNWYNYILPFALNVYLNLDKLKNINVDNGYK